MTTVPTRAGPQPTARTRRTRGRLHAPVRRAVLLVHVVAGVGWLGIAAMTFLLTFATVAEADATLVRASYEFHRLVIGALARPAALITLGTGIVLGLGTKWGITKYYWPLAKLILTVATIVITANLTSGWVATVLDGADTPLAADVVDARTNLVWIAIGHIVTIGAATWLSIYKPGGRTPWNRPAPPS